MGITASIELTCKDIVWLCKIWSLGNHPTVKVKTIVLVPGVCKH